ncbi:hypothetical protein [Gloeocapsopsis sp. IPPAS B-1203]|uniref:hypothetical protein n=1 Tax=Gloeocapsopsis sp. IPPAS B-1203 TaxID=2049454 RepID=UPI0025A0BC03|nr:hypothetical protein [Gloeocapsopsis sp. IPPAS B-1203]
MTTLREGYANGVRLKKLTTQTRIVTSMTTTDLPNLWVPLALLSLIIGAAIFFSRVK